MRRQCPSWFQERLAHIGGTNPYGEPKFKLVWGESETMRDGGYFTRDGYEGYRDVAALGGESCWALMMWEPAIMYGSPWRWYKDHTDEATGLVTLGQYPHRGRYRLLKKFVHRELVNGQWIATRMEPTHFILDVMVPLLQQWVRLSNVQRLAIIEEQKAAERKEGDRIMADSLHACKVSRSSPLVQKRLELMERTMAEAIAIASCTKLGITQMGA